MNLEFNWELGNLKITVGMFSCHGFCFKKRLNEHMKQIPVIMS